MARPCVAVIIMSFDLPFVQDDAVIGDETRACRGSHPFSDEVMTPSYSSLVESDEIRHVDD